MKELEAVFATIPILDVTGEDWLATDNTLQALRKKGCTVPLTDVLIASVVQRNTTWLCLRWISIFSIFLLSVWRFWRGVREIVVGDDKVTSFFSTQFRAKIRNGYFKIRLRPYYPTEVLNGCLVILTAFNTRFIRVLLFGVDSPFFIRKELAPSSTKSA